jgi:ribosomal silencing factor RsfS
LDREMEWVEDVVVKVFHSAVRDTFPLESCK